MLIDSTLLSLCFSFHHSALYGAANYPSEQAPLSPPSCLRPCWKTPFYLPQKWIWNGSFQHGRFSFISIRDHSPDVPLTFSMLRLILRDFCAGVAAESFLPGLLVQAVRPGALRNDGDAVDLRMEKCFCSVFPPFYFNFQRKSPT